MCFRIHPVEAIKMTSDDFQSLNHLQHINKYKKGNYWKLKMLLCKTPQQDSENPAKWEFVSRTIRRDLLLRRKKTPMHVFTSLGLRTVVPQFWALTSEFATALTWLLAAKTFEILWWKSRQTMVKKLCSSGWVKGLEINEAVEQNPKVEL